MVRVRIAPSPTGDPHVGTAYCALFNWAFARHHGGAFILRIEDTDRTRSTPESEQAIIESLRWLGLDWDEGPINEGAYGPYRQSERSEIYRTHVDKLIEKKAAYRCFCTPERLASMRAEQKKHKLQFGYDGCCRDLSDAEVEEKLGASLPHVVRLKIDKGATTSFKDEIRGDLSFENENVDDQILLKSDGFPTYHLANVVDDHLMEISHVIRAEEWISSTPKHVILYDAFGWDRPVFIHLPLLRNKDKSKISKRKNPTSLLYYREAGYLPQALLNFLSLMGWSTSDEEEVFTIERLAAEIEARHIHVGSPVFDLEKLDWLNGVYIRSLDVAQLADKVLEAGLGDLKIGRAEVEKVLPLVQERMKTLKEFADRADFFFSDVTTSADSFKKVKLPPAHIAQLLERIAPVIGEVGLGAADEVETRLRDLAAELEVKVGQLFMAVRIAVTGKSATPPLIESMAILGQSECIARMEKAAAMLME